MSLGLQGEGQWIVPITLSVGSYNNCKKFLLETKVGKLDVSEFHRLPNDKSDKPWVKVNVGHTGFYRVKYDGVLTTRLMKAIEDKCLSPEDKFGMHGSNLRVQVATWVDWVTYQNGVNQYIYLYRKQLVCQI